jgi:hypothetical protein
MNDNSKLNNPFTNNSFDEIKRMKKLEKENQIYWRSQRHVNLNNHVKETIKKIYSLCRRPRSRKRDINKVDKDLLNLFQIAKINDEEIIFNLKNNLNTDKCWDDAKFKSYGKIYPGLYDYVMKEFNNTDVSDYISRYSYWKSVYDNLYDKNPFEKKEIIFNPNKSIIIVGIMSFIGIIYSIRNTKVRNYFRFKG